MKYKLAKRQDVFPIRRMFIVRILVKKGRREPNKDTVFENTANRCYTSSICSRAIKLPAKKQCLRNLTTQLELPDVL